MIFYEFSIFSLMGSADASQDMVAESVTNVNLIPGVTQMLSAIVSIIKWNYFILYELSQKTN